MQIRIEGGKLMSGGKRPYFTFWAHAAQGPKSITVSGWKYFPDTQTISTPSVMKGQGRFVNTTRVSKEFYNDVLAQATQYFAGWSTTDTPETETEFEEVTQ